jgi:alpha-1,3-mannosyltransferase
MHGADQLLDVIAVMSKFMPLRLFMTTHGLYFHTEVRSKVKKVYLKTITKWSLSRTREVFAISSNDASILESVGVHTTLLHNPIIPLGNFICDGKDILCVGRLFENKRIDALISFMANLVGEYPTLKLHIVGGDQTNLWPRLLPMIGEHSLQENIFYHGYLDMDELTDIAKTCGFTISASRYEGFGLSVIEGMSIGLLPFMHCNAAFQETFNRSGCGLLTNFDDPAQAALDFTAWCEGITREDREKAARFAHTQTWDTVSNTYLEHYLKD